MLYHAEGIALLPIKPQNGIANGSQERAIDPSPNFIEKHYFRFGHHRAAQFKKFLLTTRQVTGKFVRDRAELKKIHNLIGTLPDDGFFSNNLPRV